ncbi:MAG: DUF1634 domain-containing protein [Bacteroidaceae bacterium]|nr:DUF1634 domain-containing protein [Bacteroidaceae bacterium]
MQELISRTLRWGVTIAGVLALIGGVCYFVQHGNAAFDLSSFATFSYDAPKDPQTTTLSGILQGVWHGRSESIIQLSVIALLLTPIMRVLLSLVDFIKQKDWLYVAITTFVFVVIITNALFF